MMVGNRRASDAAFRLAEDAQRLDPKLMARAVLPLL